MYLVRTKNVDVDIHVFTRFDPREDGCDLDVANVTVDPNPVFDERTLWPIGADAPEFTLGRDPNDPLRFGVFRNVSEMQKLQFQAVDGDFDLLTTWSQFRPNTN